VVERAHLRHEREAARHRDLRSVERYAGLADEALIAVLRPLHPTPDGDDLSPRAENR
jgi:hypothetical protein